MSDNALARREDAASALDLVISTNDLSKLTPSQRLAYYGARCEALKLNPRLRPFQYLTLDKKLVLYADKGCADQLRAIWKVSVLTKAERVGDCYMVTATATTPDGRTDQDIGAVSIIEPDTIRRWDNDTNGWRHDANPRAGKQIQGDALANAIMKATTKAKRRVTLSICGAGLPDEEDIAEQPGAVRVDLDTAHAGGSMAAIPPTPTVDAVVVETPAAAESAPATVAPDSWREDKEWPAGGIKQGGGHVAKVGVARSGNTKGKAWTLHSIVLEGDVDGDLTFSTFSSTCAAVAARAHTEDRTVGITYAETQGKDGATYRNVLEIKLGN